MSSFELDLISDVRAVMMSESASWDEMDETAIGLVPWSMDSKQPEEYSNRPFSIELIYSAFSGGCRSFIKYS